VSNKPLGKGGQGSAWKVTTDDAAFPGEYVKKELLSKGRTKPGKKQIERLKREVEVTKRLHSDGCNVVQIIDTTDDWTNDPWYVMELLEDGSLADVDGPFGGSIEAALAAFLALAGSLVSLHERSVFHRDLKPGNILIRKDGGLVLADLGLVLDLEDDHGRLTKIDERLGSKWYMAPECYNPGVRDFGKGPDIYAMGKILAFMVTGEELRSLSPVREEISIPPHRHRDLLVRCILALTSYERGYRTETWPIVLRAIEEVLHPPKPVEILMEQNPLSAEEDLRLVDNAAKHHRTVGAQQYFRDRARWLVNGLFLVLQERDENHYLHLKANRYACKLEFAEGWPFHEGSPEVEGHGSILIDAVNTARFIPPQSGDCAFISAFVKVVMPIEDQHVLQLFLATGVTPAIKGGNPNLAEVFRAGDFAMEEFPLHAIDDLPVLKSLASCLIGQWSSHIDNVLRRVGCSS
jgi:serine/threonine protein kinase